MGSALITEQWAKTQALGDRWLKATAWLSIPLLSMVLLLIAASQVKTLSGRSLAAIAPIIGLLVAFLVINGYLAHWIGRCFQLDVAANRTLAFSLGTRNSFVVLPFALALPASWSIVVTIVVLQPLVELTGMIVYLWWIPQRLLKHPHR